MRIIRAIKQLIFTTTIKRTSGCSARWVLKCSVCPLHGRESTRMEMNSSRTRAGLEFYHDVFHTCHAYGIEPLVTICHYDMPHALSVKWNGWADRRCIELFERYCRTLFAEYGHEVKYWLTFNEMNILTAPMCGYLCAGIQPAGAEGTFGPGAIDQHETPKRRNLRFQALHHQFVASAKVVALAHEMMPAAKIGCMMSSQCTYPRTCDPDDLRAAQEQRQIVNYFCSDVQVRGQISGVYQTVFSGK